MKNYYNIVVVVLFIFTLLSLFVSNLYTVVILFVLLLNIFYIISKQNMDDVK